jgi:uncharacterized protein (TIGR02271 family)
VNANSPEELFGQDVMGSDGGKIGTVDGVWIDDATSALEFIGVKTGWLAGGSHIIPTAAAQFSDGLIQIPYREDQVKGAPEFDSDAELSPSDENTIYQYYGVDRSTAPSPSGLPDGETTGGVVTNSTEGTSQVATGVAATEGGEQAGVFLSEEQLQVGKREVESGRVRLRKVVQTEHQEVPVNLQREEVQVERLDADEVGVPTDAFQESEIEVPVMREEAVLSKETRVTGGVRLNKDVETETRTVGGDVRREDVKIEGDEDASNSTLDRT